MWADRRRPGRDHAGAGRNRANRSGRHRALRRGDLPHRSARIAAAGLGEGPHCGARLVGHGSSHWRAFGRGLEPRRSKSPGPVSPTCSLPAEYVERGAPVPRPPRDREHAESRVASSGSPPAYSRILRNGRGTRRAERAHHRDLRRSRASGARRCAAAGRRCSSQLLHAILFSAPAHILRRELSHPPSRRLRGMTGCRQKKKGRRGAPSSSIAPCDVGRRLQAE